MIDYSLLAGMDPNMIKGLFSIAGDQGSSMGLDMASDPNKPPTMPEAPGGQGRPDVSGFANYGMTAPELEDPMQQLGGLMGMASYQNEPKQFQQMPQGGLMQYLMSMGV